MTTTTRIHDWETYFGVRPLEQHAAMHANGMLDRTGPAPGVALDVKATARVNGGCWIADCPADGCNGAEFVNFTDPRFFCCNCRNAGWGHQPLIIDTPTEKKRAAIEEQLEKRPVPETRNWTPGETVADLRRENAEHGIPK